MLVQGSCRDEHMPRRLINMNNSNHLQHQMRMRTSEISRLSEDDLEMEKEETVVFQVWCECCGLNEDCTAQYISRIRSSFSGKWICGLCSEAVRERLNHGLIAIEEAMVAHTNFVQETRRLNPKLLFTCAMRDILKRSCKRKDH